MQRYNLLHEHLWYLCVLIAMLLYPGQIWVFWSIFHCGFAHFFPPPSVNELNTSARRHRSSFVLVCLRYYRHHRRIWDGIRQITAKRR